MDGVIYHGNQILPGVPEFIQWLHDEKKEYLFLTNNSGYTPRELNQKLARMGLDVPEEHFYTSALATAAFLKEQAAGCSAFVIGEAGLLNALYDVGITMNDVNPDYVVVGEGRSYSLDTLTKATNEEELSYRKKSIEMLEKKLEEEKLSLKQFEEASDEFIVANISHDFRSPLTSMRGYLEAMLDGTIPPEMHEKYLSVVLNETDRLTGLTNSLLTLNNLNTKGMILDRSNFDINQVIKNTSASFEGTCRQKLISIELVLTGEEMFVNADLVKIQQVLYNLVDNAIKFSHKNSCIKIETIEKSNKLLVSVKDNGIGIPKDSVRLIWNRFYKTDLSRGKDRKGTGLGLSITKEIIQAHNENINVVSTEGVGTEFIFTLEKVDDD